jgi:hypothetical protein
MMPAVTSLFNKACSFCLCLLLQWLGTNSEEEEAQ